MSRKLSAKLLATTLVLAIAPLPLLTDTKPAVAQVSLAVSFGYFHSSLAPYGRWFHHARWGDVWLPTVASFRPYYRHGHWVYTDYGWVWVSDYRWGDIAFHYGRWVYDPEDGWLWVPGYTWAPAWVIWREGGGYVGWFPMPPDDAYLAGEEIYPVAWYNADRAYGYLDWYGPAYGTAWLTAQVWTFVPEGHFADRNFVAFAADPPQAGRIIGVTRDVTNFTTRNDFIVNHSIDPAAIQRASGRQIAPVPVRSALQRNAPMDPVSAGRQIQSNENVRHGGDPRAPANAHAVPLNAAAAAKGGRTAFGPHAANGAPGAPARGGRIAGTQIANTGRVPATHAAGNIMRGAHAPSGIGQHEARANRMAAGAGLAHEPMRLGNTHGFAAPHGALAERTHEAHFAGGATPAPRAHIAHFAGGHMGSAPRAERGPATAFGGPASHMPGGGHENFAPRAERGPVMAFGGAPGGGRPHGGPPAGFGGGPPGGGGPHGGPPAEFGGGGPHGGPPGGGGGGGGGPKEHGGGKHG